MWAEDRAFYLWVDSCLEQGLFSLEGWHNPTAVPRPMLTMCLCTLLILGPLLLLQGGKIQI